MSNLKVGDRVQSVNYPADVGTVLELLNHDIILVSLDASKGKWSYHVKDLELVEKKETEESSAVAKPSHYQILPNVEVRDICNTLADQLSDKGFKGSFIGEYMQVMQYLMRFHKKNGLEDIKKAQYLLNKLVDNYTEFP